MKQWTVMLIPHDRGCTRTLRLSGYQVWLVVLLLTTVSFSTSFFYGRSCAVNRQIDRKLRETRQELERRRLEQASKPAASASLTAQERIELEGRLRNEYNASIAAVTAKLNELREIEEAARKLTGRSNANTAKEIANAPSRGGRGGAESSLTDVAYEQDPLTITSPSFIEGLAHPSADLIIQEIDLRRTALTQMVAQLEAQQEVVLCYPNISPALFFRHGISSPFGLRKDPFTLRVAHHDGVDFMGATGSPIAATANGTVVWAGWDGDYGRTVRIDHGNGLITCYCHLQTILVATGDKVERKQVIGKLGNSGRSTGPHLHYEVHSEGRPVNPMKYMRD